MLAKLHSIAITGIDAELVEVELDQTRGMPGLVMVGLPDKAVQESRDRVKSAILNSGYQFPNRKVVINLAPAELKKEGGLYDLPIALGMLIASEQLEATDRAASTLILGELALDGTLRPARGVLAAAITARQRGYRCVMVPRENAREAAVLGNGLEVAGVRDLREAVGVLGGDLSLPDLPEETEEAEPEHLLDFQDVRGHEGLKRALVVSAAGAHNIWLGGPPGSGKTMAAKRLPTILPGLSYDESLETTKIFSIAGELRPGMGLIRRRPFRAPHHSVSAPGLVGGGTYPMPGEVSLAHNGVLFLDEAPEFSRSILENLRQPLEDGVVTISRAAGTVTYPARIMLVVSQNMCPCGRRGDPRKICRCSPMAITQYLDRLSGPLLDRVDIHVEVPALRYDELRGERNGPTSAEMREQVEAARAVQARRFPDKVAPVNASMSERDVETYCRLDANGENLLRTAMDELGLSARG
ncbi:MAG: YifB family Mg chelatase-like AAA ATPase, partial [Planctomycetota bacterium]